MRFVYLCAACVLSFQAARADIVLDWNSLACDVLVADTDWQNPGMASRNMAMLNVAVYDAFRIAEDPASTFYSYSNATGQLAGSAARDAIVAQAAYTVLSQLYPDQQSLLNPQLAQDLGNIANGQAKDNAIAVGTAIGESIYNRRLNDGYDSSSQYMPTYEPGHWQPDPLNPGQEAWGPAWGNVAPFALTSNRQFMPAPMPELTSDEYAVAFDEVKRLGSIDSTERTAEQEEIGYFWAYDRVGMGTPMRMFNNALHVISTQEGNTPEENAELFAKASVAMADAGIVAWNSKFEYDFWRPVTGIRQADSDGNDDTQADIDWTPLGAPGGEGTDFTPPFPTYVSGHASFGGALFSTMAEFYGTDNIAFTLESEELPGVERSFSSLSEAMAENGRSRVYLGIHWNFDDTIGQQLGSDIGQYISSQAFVAAVPEPAGFILMGSALALLYFRKANFPLRGLRKR